MNEGWQKIAKMKDKEQKEAQKLIERIEKDLGRLKQLLASQPGGGGQKPPSGG